MKGLKEIIVGVGFLISGVLGAAIGNMGEPYRNENTLYLSMFLFIPALIFIFVGFLKKNDK